MNSRASCEPRERGPSRSAFRKRKYLRTKLPSRGWPVIEKVLTGEERTKLVWHLAAMRARKTVECLLSALDPRDILRGG